MSELPDENSFWFGYLIGLYEGEGSINTWTLKANSNRVYARLQIRMTDEEPTVNVQRAFGGNLSGPYLSPKEAAKGYKPKYRWALGRVDEVLRLAGMMLPFMSARRQAQLRVALDTVVPAMRRRYVAGNRRDGTPAPMRPRKVGELVCAIEPEPSVRGYRRHKLLGIPVCDICLASWKLYYAEKRKWERVAFAKLTPEEQAQRRARMAGYVRASRLRKLQRAADSSS